VTAVWQNKFQKTYNEGRSGGSADRRERSFVVVLESRENRENEGGRRGAAKKKLTLAPLKKKKPVKIGSRPEGGRKRD